jgi:5-formyltetrahydrofolate cyclo-ligase
MDTKIELRSRLRAVRDATDPAQREQWSALIAKHGAAVLAARLLAGTVVSVYWPMRSEADPRPLATALAAAGAQLCLPAFVGKVMEFRRWNDGDELVPAGFGTMEPHRDAPVVVPTIVLAPLIAFDRRGNRLGWGKGYYDTFLNGLDAAAVRGAGVRPHVVGIAFACQEVPALPAEPHDRRLDAAVTERGYRPCGPTTPI